MATKLKRSPEEAAKAWRLIEKNAALAAEMIESRRGSSGFTILPHCIDACSEQSAFIIQDLLTKVKMSPEPEQTKAADDLSDYAVKSVIHSIAGVNVLLIPKNEQQRPLETQAAFERRVGIWVSN